MNIDSCVVPHTKCSLKWVKCVRTITKTIRRKHWTTSCKHEVGKNFLNRTQKPRKIYNMDFLKIKYISSSKETLNKMKRTSLRLAEHICKTYFLQRLESRIHTKEKQPNYFKKYMQKN